MDYSFSGNWEGRGSDSEGNEFTFAAKVVDLGGHEYQISILDRMDSPNRPLHIMTGELRDNVYTCTADNGIYTGGGNLKDGLFEGFYRGPVDGTYTMQKLQ